MREFFSADEAAVELQRLTKLEWTATQVLREAEDGNLPICFQHQGKIGVFNRQEAELGLSMFGKALRTTYLPRGSYLRVQGHPMLTNVNKKQVSLCPRNLELVKPARGASEVSVTASETLRIVCESGGFKDTAAAVLQVPSIAWLFHADDLSKFAPASAPIAKDDADAVPEPAPQAAHAALATPAPGELPAPAAWVETVQPLSPATSANINALGGRTKAKRCAKETLEDYLMPYIVEVFRSGTYRSAKELYKALVSKAGSDNSPFKAGTGRVDDLYVTKRGQTLADTTLNKWIARVRREAAE